MSKNDQEKFSFVVGSYWESGSVNAYAYGVTVFHGTPEEAEETRKFLSERAEKDLKIFKLVEIQTEA
jgi:hypothetical protein